MTFEVGDYGFTNTLCRSYFERVKVVHKFWHIDRNYYVVATREEPDVILAIRDAGNLYKEDPDAKT